MVQESGRVVDFDSMRVIKAWTVDQIRELIDKAKALGVSQKELAEEYVGVSQASMQYYLNGKGMNRATKRAFNFADLLITNKLTPIEEEPPDA